MKKIQYLLLTSLMLSMTACGDTTEAKQNNVKTDLTAEKTSSSTKPFIKKYAIESAEIEYQITGSMNMMGSTSKTTGTKKLTFSEYGSHELTEVNKVEEQNIMNNPKTLKTHTLDYIKEATLYKVDFKNKKIQRTQVPALGMMMGTGDEEMHTKGQKMMEKMGARPLGTDKVLGYECEVWSLMGTKQCLYQGIPLKVEANIMGVKSLEIASKIQFDLKVDKTAYKLPEFPVVNALGGEAIDKSKLAEMDEKDKKDAIDSAKRMGELGQTLKETQAKITANPDMSQEEQKEVIMEAMNNSKSVQTQLAKQKEMMPKIITLIKSYRDCLQDANSKEDAQSCDKKTEALAKKVGLEDDFSEEEEDERAWTEEGRKNIISEMNEELKMIESTLPCIEKAQNMMDVMNCNQ